MGTKGTVLIDRGGYEIYDLDGNMTTSTKYASHPRLLPCRSRFDDPRAFRQLHRRNRTGAQLHAPVSIGNVAVTMLQLSNIAWKCSVNCISIRRMEKSRQIPGHEDVAEDEKGWAPHI